MNGFAFDRLRRAPDVEAANLYAYDATDRLLVRRALSVAEADGLDGSQIAVIGDEYGAITLALVDAGYRGIRVHQDLATGRRALSRNAAALELGGFTSHELDSTLLADAELVLLKLPKALAELEELADAVARWSASEVLLVAGGRVKHMTLAQNEVLGRSFVQVQAERAEQKSRLVVASEARPAPENPPYPVSSPHPDFSLTVVAHGAAFAGSRIDIGTRTLLQVLGAQPVSAGATVVDLGCGTGVLAAVYAIAHPEARIIATDRSAAAAASARATMVANGLAGRVTVMHDDAGSELADATADIVLLNPPFHLGASVHTAAATRLFEAAARLLRPGGELWTVYNSSLAYKGELTRLIGATEQVHRTPKFTVTRSIRRG